MADLRQPLGWREPRPGSQSDQPSRGQDERREQKAPHERPAIEATLPRPRGAVNGRRLSASLRRRLAGVAPGFVTRLLATFGLQPSAASKSGLSRPAGSGCSRLYVFSVAADPPRLLARRSEFGYTASTSQALPGEAEAVDEKTQRCISTEARLRFAEARSEQDARADSKLPGLIAETHPGALPVIGWDAQRDPCTGTSGSQIGRREGEQL
jgi:hypothetical protein